MRITNCSECFIFFHPEFDPRCLASLIKEMSNDFSRLKMIQIALINHTYNLLASKTWRPKHFSLFQDHVSLKYDLWIKIWSRNFEKPFKLHKLAMKMIYIIKLKITLIIWAFEFYNSIFESIIKINNKIKFSGSIIELNFCLSLVVSSQIDIHLTRILRR
jgi:hypothetical protein